MKTEIQTERARRTALASLLLAVVAMALLAIALPRLELKPGIPLPGRTGDPARVPAGDDPPVSIAVDTYFKAILEVVAVLLAAFCGYKLFRGVPWRDLLVPAVLLTVVTLAILCILFAMLDVRVTVEPDIPEILPPELPAAGPPLGPVPAALIWLVCAGLAVAIVLLGLWLGKQARHAPVGDPLTLEAVRAMEALKAGANFKNVIVRCYLQMSLALQTEQGIERKGSMTAREFERLLEMRGLPGGPVRQLTALFEAARYGSRPPDPGDEEKALDCLSAIVQYSREHQPSAVASR